MSKTRLTIHELSALEIHDSRYSDKYMYKAKLDALYWRVVCPTCSIPMFKYDPDDHDYLKCHKCGSRKLVPLTVSDFTPDWGNEQRRKDGFEYLFGEQKGDRYEF